MTDTVTMLFAMGGIAEAAVFKGLLLVAAILSLSGGLLALAWRKRWPMAAGIAVFVCLLVGLLVQPWMAFVPTASHDPDELFWRLWLRIVSVMWVIMVLAGLVTFGLLLRERRAARRVQRTTSKG